MAGKPTRASERRTVTLTWASRTRIGKDPVFRRLMVLASTALIIGVLAGCGTTDSWVQAHAADGWPAQYGDAANSSYSPVAGANALRLEWRRSVKGDLAAQVSLGSGSYLAVNAQSAGGCSLMVWETDNKARQRWCTRLVQGGGLSSPLFDGFDNLYIGQPGAMLSFPPTQWIRWRPPVIGMPTTPRSLAPVLVFDAQKGTVVGTSLDLIDGVNPTDSTRGLADCQPMRPRCPVAAAPAFASATGNVVVSLWEPNAAAPALVGLRYRPGQAPLLTREWTSDAVGQGPIASPVLSADGSTVYVNGRDEHLWAINTADGKPKWSVPLNYLAQTPPSVSPDGLIVAGGGPGAQLGGGRGGGGHGEVRWTRDDVVPLSTSSRAGNGGGYTVAKGGENGQALLVFGPAEGPTLDSYPLPQAARCPV